MEQELFWSHSAGMVMGQLKKLLQNPWTQQSSKLLQIWNVPVLIQPSFWPSWLKFLMIYLNPLRQMHMSACHFLPHLSLTIIHLMLPFLIQYITN